jgi:DHA3 family macrolide efflux protein-like MFS transporter
MATQFSVKDHKPWKSRFFKIWSGQAFSIIGSQLVQFALIWYLTIDTGSATVLATAAMVGTLPQLILGPFVGDLVDRWNRRRIMRLADSTITVFIILLALRFALNDVDVWHIYMLMFVRSLAASFHGNDPNNEGNSWRHILDKCWNLNANYQVPACNQETGVANV